MVYTLLPVVTFKLSDFLPICLTSPLTHIVHVSEKFISSDFAPLYLVPFPPKLEPPLISFSCYQVPLHQYPVGFSFGYPGSLFSNHLTLQTCPSIPFSSPLPCYKPHHRHHSHSNHRYPSSKLHLIFSDSLVNKCCVESPKKTSTGMSLPLSLPVTTISWKSLFPLSVSKLPLITALPGFIFSLSHCMSRQNPGGGGRHFWTDGHKTQLITEHISLVLKLLSCPLSNMNFTSQWEQERRVWSCSSNATSL